MKAASLLVAGWLTAAMAGAQCSLQLVPVNQVGGGVNGAAHAGGVTYITGFFSQLGGATWNGIAKANGSGWSPLGSGLQGAPSWSSFPPIPFGAAVEPLRDAAGSLVVGGQFVTAGGVVANGLARYDGTTWFAMGGGVNGTVRALAADGSGGVYAGGEFTTVDGVAASRIAHWDGATWASLGSGVDTPGGSVLAMTVTAEGDLVVTGKFQSVGGVSAQGIACWDGASWSAPPGISVPASFSYSLAATPSGELFVGGEALVAGVGSSLARWDGVAWQSLLPAIASGPRALEVLPDGSLVVQTPSGLSRWRDGQWSTLTTVSGVASAIYANDEGQLLLGGSFAQVGGGSASHVARLQSPCVAQAAPAGDGCAWSGGAAALTVTAPAWIGGTYGARGSGLPPNALAASVYGFSQATSPLWAALPMTGANCFSHTSADFVELAVPAAGMLDTDEPMPADPALNGASFYHQLIVFELDAQGVCVGVTSSNALQLTLGVL